MPEAEKANVFSERQQSVSTPRHLITQHSLDVLNATNTSHSCSLTITLLLLLICGRLADFLNAKKSDSHLLTTNCTFLDATKAFDRIDYCKLFRELLRWDLPAICVICILTM